MATGVQDDSQSAVSSGLAAQGDPNFPPLLRIVPSSSTAGVKEQCQDEGAADWDQDTVEDIEAFGIAGRIWEAAYLLRLYLRTSTLVEFDPPSSLFGATSSNIIELGSGVGYVGLHFARQLTQYARLQSQEQHHCVVLTDLENVCQLLQRNARRAGLAVPDSASPEVQVLVRALPWGSSSHAHQVLQELYPTSSSAQPLTILCSDLVYFPALLAPLLRSLITLTQTSRANAPVRIIMAYRIRSLTKEEPFWRAFGCWFAFDVVRCRRRLGFGERQDEWERFGKFKWHLLMAQDDVDGAEEEAEDDYFILSAVRHVDSLGAAAPKDDAKLMSGFRLRPHPTEDAPEEEAYEQGLGGEEFELMLMRQFQSI